jgi:cyanate permease
VGPIALGRAFDATGSYTIALVELAFVTLAASVLMLTVRSAPTATMVGAAEQAT